MEVCNGREHIHPVHFNRGRHGHIWACLGCGKQLAGPVLPKDEFEALIAFGKYLNQDLKTRKGQQPKGRESKMQLLITVKDGATNVDIAHALRFQANLIEGIEPKTASSKKNTSASKVTEEEEVEEETVEEEVDDFAPKKKTKSKAAAAFDSEEEEETEEEEAPAKKTKAKKLTIDDVNDACKARAAATGGKEGRAEVFTILKKKFKTESVSNLKPEQFAAVIAAMEVE